MPVEEPLKSAVEVELRAGAQQSVGLRRVGHVLERLARAAAARRRAARTASGSRARPARRARSAAAPRCSSSRWNGRARAVRLARGRRRAHHPLEVLHALAVALRPGRHDVAVAVLADRAAEAVLGIVGDREQRHVGAVARAEDARAGRRRPSRACAGSRRRPGSPSCRRRPRRRGWRARSRGRSPWSRGSSARARRSPCRRSTARGRPTRRRSTTVGPAVRVDHRRHRASARRVARAHQERRDLEAVEGRGSVTSSSAACGALLTARGAGACTARAARRVLRRGAARGGVAWSS